MGKSYCAKKEYKTAEEYLSQSKNIAIKNNLDNELIEISSKQLNKNSKLLHLSKELSIATVKLLNKLKIKSPVTVEQILRINEPKVFDHSTAKDDFNYQPRTFDLGVKEEIDLI